MRCYTKLRCRVQPVKIVVARAQEMRTWMLVLQKNDRDQEMNTEFFVKLSKHPRSLGYLDKIPIIFQFCGISKTEVFVKGGNLNNY